MQEAGEGVKRVEILPTQILHGKLHCVCVCVRACVHVCVRRKKEVIL